MDPFDDEDDFVQHDIAQNDTSTTWYPQHRDCTCCQGYIYACTGEMCQTLGVCDCAAEENYKGDDASPAAIDYDAAANDPGLMEMALQAAMAAMQMAAPAPAMYGQTHNSLMNGFGAGSGPPLPQLAPSPMPLPHFAQQMQPQMPPGYGGGHGGNYGFTFQPAQPPLPFAGGSFMQQTFVGNNSSPWSSGGGLGSLQIGPATQGPSSTAPLQMPLQMPMGAPQPMSMMQPASTLLRGSSLETPSSTPMNTAAAALLPAGILGESPPASPGTAIPIGGRSPSPTTPGFPTAAVSAAGPGFDLKAKLDGVASVPATVPTPSAGDDASKTSAAPAKGAWAKIAATGAPAPAKQTAAAAPAPTLKPKANTASLTPSAAVAAAKPAPSVTAILTRPTAPSSVAAVAPAQVKPAAPAASGAAAVPAPAPSAAKEPTEEEKIQKELKKWEKKLREIDDLLAAATSEKPLDEGQKKKVDGRPEVLAQVEGVKKKLAAATSAAAAAAGSKSRGNAGASAPGAAAKGKAGK